MIWKTTILLSLALCVLGDGPYATSEQRIKIHKTEHHEDHGDLKHIGSHQPEHHEEYAWSYPSYEFSYKVHDPHTHDMKGQEETRHGDEVKGEYWLIQPDGHKRTVTYHVDKDSGFIASVKYDHHEEDDHDDKKHGEEDGSDGKGHSEHGGEAMDGEDAGHGDDKGHDEKGGSDAEESRGLEDYRHAWAIARKEHVREESRRNENRGARGHGHHGLGDMTILENMGSYGRRDSGYGRGRADVRNHKGHNQDIYSYPRFYRHT